MDSHPSVTDRPVRIPRIVWFLGIGLVIALIAIFIFNVAVGTAAYYGLLAFMLGIHFFMHGSHAGHDSHTENQSGVELNSGDVKTNDHGRHSGGCH